MGIFTTFPYDPQSGPQTHPHCLARATVHPTSQPLSRVWGINTVLRHKHYANRSCQSCSHTELHRWLSAAHVAHSLKAAHTIKPGHHGVGFSESLLVVSGLPQTWHHQGLIHITRDQGLPAWWDPSESCHLLPDLLPRGPGCRILPLSWYLRPVLPAFLL